VRALGFGVDVVGSIFHSRHIEQLIYEAQLLGLQGLVAGSHLTFMQSMGNDHVPKRWPLMAEAEVSAIPNPLINITIHGRHDTYPKKKGHDQYNQETL